MIRKQFRPDRNRRNLPRARADSILHIRMRIHGSNAHPHAGDLIPFALKNSGFRSLCQWVNDTLQSGVPI
jgi:hypothetical protein